MEDQLIRELISLKDGNLKDKSFRNICVSNEYSNSFAHILKQLLIINGLGERDEKRNFLLKEGLTSSFLKVWVPKISKLSRTYSDEKVLGVHEKVKSLEKRFFHTEIKVEGVSEKEMPHILNLLYRLGKLTIKKQYEGKIVKVEYCSKEYSNFMIPPVVEESKDHKEAKIVSEHETKLLKVLTRLASFGDKGTRLNLSTFLKENGAPYYSILAGIILENNLVIISKKEGITRVIWNSGRLKIPNISSCSMLLTKAHSYCKNRYKNSKGDKTTSKEKQVIVSESFEKSSSKKEIVNTTSVDNSLLAKLIHVSLQNTSEIKPLILEFLEENPNVKDKLKDLVYSNLIKSL